jgi:ABC-type spermidine/putrescine transport system permease subunit II
MNTITWIVAIFTLWLVMGLGFAAAWAEFRRRNRPFREALTSIEGLLFIASLILPLVMAAVSG